jgi:Pyruvate/2-oxoacid:ferredoxin oxidoreductase gamma subunit
VVISEDGLKKTRGHIEKLASSATLYVEESLELPVTNATVIRLPFIATAKKVNRLSVGIVALAGMLHDSGLFPLDALRDSISAFQKQAIADVNLQALDAGVAAMGAEI